MDNFTYSNPVKYIFGKDQVDVAGQEAAALGKRVLLVYGQEHIKNTGLYDRIVADLNANGLEIVDLPGVHPNPRVSLVRDGIQACRDEKIDLLLGVGGGSTCDTTKAIAFGVGLGADVWESYETFHHVMHGNHVEKPVVPKACLPFGIVMTKHGTGSDFDYTSVLSNRDLEEKLMVIDKVMYPRFSIIDPSLAFTLPKKETAFGVADIMTHVMEQYFAPTADVEILDQYKEANLRCVIDAGRTCLEKPDDYTARAQLFYVASWACSDQSMTGTSGGWDAHMIEHELSAVTDLNHGHGMAIVYLGWMKYMLDHLPAKFARFARNVWNVQPRGRDDRDVGMEGIERLAEFWKELGISLTLGSVGIDDKIAAKAANRAVRFGPLGVIHKLQEKDVSTILQTVR